MKNLWILFIDRVLLNPPALDWDHGPGRSPGPCLLHGPNLRFKFVLGDLGYLLPGVGLLVSDAIG